jgi:hypothetical protein
MPAFRVWASMPIGNPKSMQAWDGVKYLGQLYAYAETSLEKGGCKPVAQNTRCAEYAVTHPLRSRS